MQRFNNFIMSLAKTTADAAEELEPTWKWTRLIAAIFGIRYDAENAKLPPPQRKIEPPTAKLPPPGKQLTSLRWIGGWPAQRSVFASATPDTPHPSV
jgi:hypothetical protein